MAITLKQQRIDIRVSNDTKSILERAAELNNVSLSSYIISTALKQARKDLIEYPEIKLKPSEAKIIIDSINNPEEPNKLLQKLMKK